MFAGVQSRDTGAQSRYTLPMAPTSTLLQARASRFAADLIAMAAPAPARPVSDGVLMIYTQLREALSGDVPDDVMGVLPRFGAGAKPTYGQLAIYSGQLAAIAQSL